MTEALEQLVDDLTGARAAGEALAGRPAVGVRAVEIADGRRGYLCAFESSFLCLDAGFAAERDARRARQLAACALMVEHAESLVDGPELELVATLCGRILTAAGADGVEAALGGLAEASIALAGWRTAPERAVASLPELDRGIRLHEAVRVAYGRYLEASEPLVGAQDHLDSELVQALRDLEEAAGRAGLARELAAEIAQAMDAIDGGADEILAAHLVPVSDD